MAGAGSSRGGGQQTVHGQADQAGTQETKVRLLCCSDLHNGIPDATRLAARVREERLDAMVVGGDLGHFLTQDELMWSILARTGKRVLVVPGNHDAAPVWSEMVRQAGATDVDGRLVWLGQVAVIGWGWRWASEEWRPAPPPDPKLRALRALHQGIDPRRLVLVTHQPPWGVRVARTEEGEDLGDRQLRAYIEEARPAAVVCGHVHLPCAQTSRVGETLIVNGGRAGYVLQVG